MKFGYYIVYGNAKPVTKSEERIETFEKFGKVLKKYNMELVFWGGSFGTQENMVYVMKGTMEDYQSLFNNPDYHDADPNESGQRTNFVLKL